VLALQKKYRPISVVLRFLTIVAGLAIALLVMAKSRSALGLPMGTASLEGIRLKFLTWLTICLFSIPLAFYLSRVFVYGAFALLMVSGSRFTTAEAKQFALYRSYPSGWLQLSAPEPIEPIQAVGSDISRDDKKKALVAGLISDNEEAVAAFGESDNCVVVDWRDGFEEILEALTPFVPHGYLQVKKLGNTNWKIRAGDRPPHKIEFAKNTKQEELFVTLNEVLRPDFELRQYTSVDGDGYSLFVAPTAWWHSFADEHPRVLAKYFLSATRLAAHQRKHFLARLISKP
jgi:hypothetical protein